MIIKDEVCYTYHRREQNVSRLFYWKIDWSTGCTRMKNTDTRGPMKEKK